MDIVLALFLVTFAAVLGGFFGKLVKLPSLVGYILAGIVFGSLLPSGLKNISSLASIGTILLLFSIGIELSFDSLSRFLKIAVFGGLIQVVLVTAISYFLLQIFGMNTIPSLILSLAFSVSSTAVLVKILSDRGEVDTIHGQIMFGWSLVQDLLVIPIMVILPIFANSSSNWIVPVGLELAKAIVVVLGTVFFGKIVIPAIFHKVADTNNRELLLLSSVALALGTAGITSFFGISPALGAFLAGIVISESQEHHAIFAETRPLRDLFVALFFVTLGFLVNPMIIASKIGLIVGIALVVLVVKSIVVFAISTIFNYKGKTAVAVSFGLAQIGEFAFVILSTALTLKMISETDITIGIGITLLTLILSPILYGLVIPFWRKVKFIKLFSSVEKQDPKLATFQDHIIICGFGRVGKWVGKALSDFEIPFVVIEYNQKVVNELRDGGTPVIYGDPTEPEVLEAVSLRGAKALVIAIPDRVAQETLITYVQTVAPGVKIISRAHFDEDWDKLKRLRVDKIVQPEFEAALEIVRSILLARGREKGKISEAVRGLRLSHAK